MQRWRGNSTTQLGFPWVDLVSAQRCTPESPMKSPALPRRGSSCDLYFVVIHGMMTECMPSIRAHTSQKLDQMGGTDLY